MIRAVSQRNNEIPDLDAKIKNSEITNKNEQYLLGKLEYSLESELVNRETKWPAKRLNTTLKNALL
jgi:hypothetical protein